MGSYALFPLLRAIAMVVAIVCGVVLLAGFVAQFAGFGDTVWGRAASDYTAPVARLVRDFLPTVYQDVDGSLLVALGLLYVAYAVAERLLRPRESSYRESSSRGLRPMPMAERPMAAPAAGAAPRPAAPVAASSTAANPAYRSEAIVVIDMVKSSDLISRFGNSLFYTLRQRMERLLSPIAARHAMAYAGDTGDGFFYCFPSVSHAAEAVKEIIQAVPLLNNDLPDGAEAALRGAVNFGEVIVESRGGNRTGTAVHKTFRLQGVGPATVIEAEGGVAPEDVPQKNCVFISEEAVLGLQKVPGFRHRFIGLTELKGLPGLHRVYQLEW